ncbi:ABC transporter ATP-binding protein [Alloalcanivorax sp. C16-2]|uniref:ABC transporter ATP-binding protein n=1 Tax=Alloalcanivorax TaxID=3020832 RepID=UPI001932E9D5|nr:ABC transporter ATP-binding protein [Alloalcanivorax marinus]MBL7249212.1 ABC transporter ATP-binding protein [Alloalcanivorax marinus]
MSQDMETKKRGASVAIRGVGMDFTRRGETITALDDVTLDIPAGTFCSILGPSGCGKSTLMSLVSGLDTPTRGEVRLDGKTLQGAFHDVGIVFQSDVLLPWVTVLDNVLLPAKVKKQDIGKARERGRKLLENVGLGGFLDHYPGELSGGMRQRASICRALVAEPSVLLMDEPFGALDALTREKMQRDLNRIWAEDAKTVMFITHDIEEAVTMADQVIVMSPRPGKVLTRYEIDFPQPRRPEIRRDPRFQDIVDDIRHVFQTAGVL